MRRSTTGTISIYRRIRAAWIQNVALDARQGNLFYALFVPDEIWVPVVTYYPFLSEYVLGLLVAAGCDVFDILAHLGTLVEAGPISGATVPLCAVYALSVNTSWAGGDAAFSTSMYYLAAALTGMQLDTTLTPEQIGTSTFFDYWEPPCICPVQNWD